MKKPKLGVNIDHVATLRQLRGTRYPDPVSAASQVEKAGADQVTVHLREDRRHIQDADVRLLRRTIQTELNLEMALTDEMVRIAMEIKPDQVTFVPEKRRELTTEGGLDALRNERKLRKVIPLLIRTGIRVSLFIDPDPRQVTKAAELGADAFEIHTGTYADCRTEIKRKEELKRIAEAAHLGTGLDLWVAAGHGLNYDNIRPFSKLPLIREYNIGHAIIARSLFVGLGTAVTEMKGLLDE